MIRKIFSSYILFIMLLSCVALAFGISITLNRLNAETDKAISAITAQSSVMTFKTVSEKSSELYTAADKAKVLVYTDKEAKDSFLNTLDSFLKKYSAKVISPMTKKENSYRSRVSFRFTPRTPQELATLLEYLENSSSPIFMVESTEFINGKNGRYIYITAEIIQPFAGEK
jgi:hypothetical protein